MKNLWTVRCLAALTALCAFALTACATTSAGNPERFGATFSPSTSGYLCETLLDDVPLSASVTSDVLVIQGFSRKGWIKVELDDMAGGTDSVASLFLEYDEENVAADFRPLDLDADLIIVESGTSLPAGLSVNADGESIDVAVGLATDHAISVPMQNLPPYLRARLARTSGGTDATVRVVVCVE